MSVNQFYSSIHRDLLRTGQKSPEDLQSDMIKSALCANSAKPINLSYNKEISTENETKSFNVLHERNKTTYIFSIQESWLNDPFRHCCNYLKSYRNKGRGLDIKIECNVIHLEPDRYHSCNNTYYKADTSEVCDVKRSSDYLKISITTNDNAQEKQDIILSKINLTTSDMIITLMCHLEGKKDMYEKGIFRNAKHRIIQPIILRSLPTSRMSTLNSQYSLFTHSPMVSTIPNNVHLVTFDVTVLCTILTIFVILLLVVSLIWYIKLGIRRKTFRHGDRSEPEIHGQSINESFELLESANASLLENQINPEHKTLYLLAIATIAKSCHHFQSQCLKCRTCFFQDVVLILMGLWDTEILGQFSKVA